MFAATYEHRNIVKAAKFMSLHQSTLSKAVVKIEANLEMTLFKRSSRGVSPTPFGDVLYHHAKVILNEFRYAANDLARVGNADTGRIIVGVVPASTSILATSIARFKRDRPGVTVTVEQGTDDHLLAKLRVGELDFVFGRLYDENRLEGLTQEALFDDPLRVVARSDHPLARKRRIALAALVERPWVLPHPGAFIRARIDQAFVDNGLEPPTDVVETVSINLTRSLLLNSDMMTVSPLDTYGHDLSSGHLAPLPVDFSIELSPIGISVRSDSPLQQPAATLVDDLKSAAREFG